MKVRENLRILKDDGWYLVATEGSHEHWIRLARGKVASMIEKPKDSSITPSINRNTWPLPS
jgi:predicted RNA binding protein YcfA (HicA-like mRNA interferase family)